MATLGHQRGDLSATPVEHGATIRVSPAVSYLLFVALLVYSGLQMTMGGALDETFHVLVGPVDVYVFDVLLFAAIMLLLAEFLGPQRTSIPSSNRLVILLILCYCVYQLAVVLPIAVIFHDLEPVAVFRDVEERLGLALIPFMYLVVLRHIPYRRVILLVNVTAAAVALYALYAYVTVGTGADFTVGKFRAVDGHASFLFAFLILTSLFLWRPSIFSFAAAMLGLVGIVFANHRSAYLALLAVGIPLFFHFRRASARTIVVLAVLLSATVLVVSTSPAVRDSVYYSLETMVNPTADRNTLDRVDRSRLGWDYFVAHPLGDHVWNQRYYLIDVPWAFEPHNFIIQILNAQGIIGFTLISAMLVVVGRMGWRNRRVDRVTVVMLAAFGFYLLFSLFNTTILTSWNILMLAVPAGIILKREADLLATSEATADAARLEPPGIPSPGTV